MHGFIVFDLKDVGKITRLKFLLRDKDISWYKRTLGQDYLPHEAVDPNSIAVVNNRDCCHRLCEWNDIDEKARDNIINRGSWTYNRRAKTLMTENGQRSHKAHCSRHYKPFINL